MMKVCEDMTFVKSFMQLPEIWRYCAEYGSDKSALNPEGWAMWLSYSDNEKVIGYISLKQSTGCAIEFHPYILRAHKSKYDVMVKTFFTWFVGNFSDQLVKLNAIIPIVFNGAIRAAERAGMTLEGVDRMSYISEKGVCDRNLYGITREELEK